MQKVTPCLWFDGNDAEAMDFYTSIFKNAKVTEKMHTGKAGPGPDGTLLVARFELEGQAFMVLNGGPNFTFNEAVSFYVNCGEQAEVDYFWEQLTADGGEGSMCGWLKDKFALSWQIVPEILEELLWHTDAGTSGKVMQALMQMRKINIAALKEAAYL
ncbi:VOC family protein [soil metagenome]|jgi:predicted 3-demethylubiquinone-9 3-methyltransferase (glyoxalase superfamily)